jgi:hypothetical protein
MQPYDKRFRPTRVRAQGTHQRPLPFKMPFINAFDGQLLGPVVRGDNYDVLAIYRAFERLRCHR